MAEEKNQKRQVAYKLTINDILKSNYVKGEEWNPNYLVLEDKKMVSRVNVVATIVNKQTEDNSTYQNIMIDDGSGNISLRLFDNIIRFDDLSIGDSIMVIGRPREFGNERYIVPEIIKKIENKDWIELRKIELMGKSKKEMHNIEVYNVEEDIINDNPDILTIIRQLDKGDGADFNDIARKLNAKDAEKIINNMIKMGELFEIRPGKIKILE